MSEEDVTWSEESSIFRRLGYFGQRGVSVLSANRTVKWIEGLSTEMSGKAKLPQALEWAGVSMKQL